MSFHGKLYWLIYGLAKRLISHFYVRTLSKKYLIKFHDFHAGYINALIGDGVQNCNINSWENLLRFALMSGYLSV